MTTITATPMLPHEVEIHLAYEQLKTHAWDNFHYRLTQTDIEELIFSDMWGSLEQFIEYMGQEGVNVGTPIEGTANYKPPPTTQLYTNEELAAMDALILPLDYAISPRSIDEQIEAFERHNPLEDPDDEDIDAESVFTDYSGDTLPPYDGIKLPPYQANLIEHIYICNEASSNLPKNSGSSCTTDSDPEVQRRKNPFAKIRPRISSKAKRLREKLRFRKDGISTMEEPTRTVLENFPGERILESRKLAEKLSHLSPQRALRRVRDFITFRSSRFG
ncbi:hypothetical protein F5B22DRAFT_655232 [Xylaria bambusicola]|uniref:uncharacterized protein n=1 Tax=Xylaria bambusicola TaxID=326684 RepID=UPI0020074149|nr:uncharacterized protein F5B22DRAFT_655232 [Xylaria bambusicola]KAI0516933.1 hypothetical protein F5B22DRAFT_655232 [Xylaria bambusicola]